MADYRLAEQESKFADIIWDNEPIASGELITLSRNIMNWQKSTTYTILRRLCQRGLFQNQGSIITSLVSRDEFYSRQSHQYVESNFGGSLPKFVAAFVGGRKLSKKQAEELIRLINESRGGK